MNARQMKIYDRHEAGNTGGHWRLMMDDAMDKVAQGIYQKVMDAMQPAEEMGGPEGDNYLALMLAIAKEATDRAANFAAMSADTE